jgi:hypothetical protein
MVRNTGTLIAGLFFIIIPLFTFSCRSTPSGRGYFQEEHSYIKIEGIPSPEDMVLDKWHTPPRILVSSKGSTSGTLEGSIYVVDIDTNVATEMIREGEPEGLAFHPLGIDIVQNKEGTTLLYVITGTSDTRNPSYAVLSYEVIFNRLVFVQSFKDPLLVSPNDITADSDSRFYVSNGVNSRPGLLKRLYTPYSSNVVFHNGEGEWSIAADGFDMANGLILRKKHVFVADTQKNAVYRFSKETNGVLSEKTLFVQIWSPENLTLSGNRLIVASNPKSFAFFRILTSRNRRTPTYIYSVKLADRQLKPVFFDDGSRISAATVGVRYRDSLYVGQVHGPFVLKFTGTLVLTRSTINGIIHTAYEDTF